MTDAGAGRAPAPKAPAVIVTQGSISFQLLVDDDTDKLLQRVRAMSHLQRAEFDRVMKHLYNRAMERFDRDVDNLWNNGWGGHA